MKTNFLICKLTKAGFVRQQDSKGCLGGIWANWTNNAYRIQYLAGSDGTCQGQRAENYDEVDQICVCSLAALESKDDLRISNAKSYCSTWIQVQKELEEVPK